MPRSVYESYSTFANTKGGYIILGVKEDTALNQVTLYLRMISAHEEQSAEMQEILLSQSFIIGVSYCNGFICAKIVVVTKN